MVEVFYVLGSPVVASSALESIRVVWMAFTMLVTIGFLAYTFITWRRGEPCSVVKLAVMASSFSFWWYATVHLKPIILGVAAFEIFHDVQYLAIVWVYNRTRVQTGRPVGEFTRFLFRGNLILIALYVLLVLAYGYLGLVVRTLPDEGLRLTLYGFVAASAFLHYYYDGFIWKIREPATSAALGVHAAGGGAAKPAAPAASDFFGRGWAHALKWSPFIVPAVWLLATGLRTEAVSLDQRRAVVATVPQSVDAHVNFGDALLNARQFEEAEAEYAEAMRLSPRSADVLYNSGIALQGLKRFDEAARRFEEAVRIRPAFAEAQFAWGNALQRQDRFGEAVAHYQAALSLKPDYAEAHYNWSAAMQALGRKDEADAHYQEALRLNPVLSAVRR
jgi:tetratricopeptide (TPR) repeat protein